MDEITDLKRHKKQLEIDLASMLKDADDLAQRAELTRQLTLIVKSNSLHRLAKDKSVQLPEVTVKLNSKLQELKNNQSFYA